jgi:hypothetical protein
MMEVNLDAELFFEKLGYFYGWLYLRKFLPRTIAKGGHGTVLV